ncbi:sulfate reduction electron transfer complex DsrMKJOP subunit DsrP [Geomobilimonas luticola]|uniref:Polysulfide reductase NrfD n=1 Tax=Geomobilimonas luticola TaxID=1114878 RepID=A0ABS5SA17_9BACT|nr:NrfD/PsrC family molybdoenzyme membrane anchor subunit [Geomobilimonas luticola]MBT0651436.1 polysulfide reductase NrfD [Geomobilimonas luticola]
MLDKALKGSGRYWGWIAFLLALIAVGFTCYLRQLAYGLGITGLSRDVSWGIYIAQFTFFVGVAASAVMVVLPYYLHNVQQFARITILGELLAVAAVTMCMLFIFVDMGQPARVLNVLLYPTPHSMMFWDMISLTGYLLLNGVIAWVMLSAEQKGRPAPSWIKPVIILSIPWAISIHTVTAFLYNGLPGRPLWFTAILAPRFLASAFASGPALLILLCLALRRLTSFDAGQEAIRRLGVIVAYAMTVNVFFLFLELFTALYSGMPDHAEPFEYLFFGLDGKNGLVPVMWLSVVLALASLLALLVPRFRRNERVLALASLAVFLSLWLEKGMGLIVAGFVPSPLRAVTSYAPTAPEWGIVAGVWGIGALLLTIFYKITVSLREAN